VNRKFSWKKAFFILIGINIFSLLIICILFFIPAKEFTNFDDDTRLSSSQLEIQANKKNLNDLINQYIEKETKNSKVKYRVNLENHVELYGMIDVFDTQVQMQLNFESKALDNGDLLLTLSSIQVGQLNLPTYYVLNFIKNVYAFPEWVDIYPNEKVIYLHITEIEMKNDMKIKIDEFDLPNDHISISLLIEE